MIRPRLAPAFCFASLLAAGATCIVAIFSIIAQGLTIAPLARRVSC